MPTLANPTDPVARVNGVALHAPDEALAPEALRQRACTELLRQAAQRAGLLDPSRRAAARRRDQRSRGGAIDALLERAGAVPEPSEEACRRHYAAQCASVSRPASACACGTSCSP